RMRERLLDALKGKTTAKDKLLALFAVARNAAREEAFRGGCPIMNLAVESDDADPALRDAARQAMGQLIGVVERVIAEGIKQSEFPAGDAHARATLIVASLEGGVLLSNLYKDRKYMETVLDHLERSIQTGCR